MQKIRTQKLPFTDYSYTEYNRLTKTDAKWRHHDIRDHGLEITFAREPFRLFSTRDFTPLLG